MNINITCTISSSILILSRIDDENLFVSVSICGKNYGDNMTIENTRPDVRFNSKLSNKEKLDDLYEKLMRKDALFKVFVCDNEYCEIIYYQEYGDVDSIILNIINEKSTEVQMLQERIFKIEEQLLIIKMQLDKIINAVNSLDQKIDMNIT